MLIDKFAQISMQAEIVIDDRERAAGLAQALKRKLGANPPVTRLPLGDVRIGSQYLIERKTVPDLVASLLDGRFEDQMRRLASGVVPPQRALIILEGEIDSNSLSGLSPYEFREALLKMQFNWVQILISSRDLEDTAAWIEILMRRAASAAPHLPFNARANPLTGAPHR